MTKTKKPKRAPAGHYGENKEMAAFRITPTAKRLLTQQAELMGVSTSELLERIGRGQLMLQPGEELLGESSGN